MPGNKEEYLLFGLKSRNAHQTEKQKEPKKIMQLVKNPEAHIKLKNRKTQRKTNPPNKNRKQSN